MNSFTKKWKSSRHGRVTRPTSDKIISSHLIKATGYQYSSCFLTSLHYAQSRHLYNSSILILIPLFSRSSVASMDSHLRNNFFSLKYVNHSGIPAAGFSDRSIRKGAAMRAAANGISKENIQHLGRWRSECRRYLY